MATMRPGDMNMSTTPTLSNKSLPPPPPPLKTSIKPTAPRIDVEPLYIAVKGAISDADWAIYKATIRDFLLGRLNQEEVSARLDRILSTPALEHAHNQFIVAIYQNSLRDPPEPGTASWADDKVVGKSGAGGKGASAAADEAEKRLKFEVMQLARRERKRLKGIQDVPGVDDFGRMMQEMADSKKIRTPDTGPASAGGFQKTNWDIEILKRYTAPLFTETLEFPDAHSIATRMLPICYENGLPSGHASDCAAFMNIATETYIKEFLTNMFGQVSENGPSYVKTAEYKRKIERDEAKVLRGEIVRSTGGLLPSEVEEMRKRRPLCMEDLRLALELGDPYLGQVPIIAGQITNARFLDTYGVEEVYDEEPKGKRLLLNGINSAKGDLSNGDAMVNGYHVDLGDPMALDDDWQWMGGGVGDVDGLDGVLDGCLAVGT